MKISKRKKKRGNKKHERTKPNSCKTDEMTSYKAYTILNMGRKTNQKTECQETLYKSEHRKKNLILKKL